MFAMTSWQALSKWSGMAARKNGSPQNHLTYTPLPKTNECPLKKRQFQKESRFPTAFQPLFFRGRVSFGGSNRKVRNHLRHVCLRIHGRIHPVLKNHLHSTLSTATHRVPWIARLNGPEPSRHRWWQTPRLKWGLDTNRWIFDTLKANIAMQNVRLWKKTCVKFKLLLDFCGVMVEGFTRYYLLCTKLPGIITPEQPEIHWVIQAQNWWLFWDSAINFGMNQANLYYQLMAEVTCSTMRIFCRLCDAGPVFSKETVQPEKPT